MKELNLLPFIYLAGSLTASLSLEELLGFHLLLWGELIVLVFLLVFYIWALLGKPRQPILSLLFIALP